MESSGLQCAIGRNLGISPSTTLKVIKRLKEPGQISANKRQSEKSLLNACDFQSLRWHYIKNWHDSIKDIKTWTQQHSVAASKKASQDSIIRGPITSRKAANFSASELSWDGLMQSWKVSFGVTSPQIVFGSHGCLPWAKEEVKQCFISQYLWWYGVVCKGILHMMMAPLILKSTCRVWNNMLTITMSFPGPPCVFQQDRLAPHYKYVAHN